MLNDVETPAVASGFTSHSIELEKAANGLLYPAAKEYAGIGASRDLEVLNRDKTGVSWYPKPGRDARFDTGNAITVPAEEGALSEAVKAASAGDVISLASGTHLVARTLLVDRPLTIRSADNDDRATLEFERTALFEIQDGGSLKLSGLNISGNSSPDNAGNTVIRTSRYSMLNNYVLIVEDSAITDLDTNHSFNFFSLAKHTFADRIAISNSSFRNITGHVLYMNKEIEDLGIYNGEYISITGSEFENIEGTVADIYRGGTDESTFGPHFELSDSKITNVGKGSRNKSGASVHLLGVQATNIRTNSFESSALISVVHTVGDPITTMTQNAFESTPEPSIVETVK